MRDKRDAATSGEIALRQTVQLAIGNQARTLEIAITLPHDADPEDMERAIQQAQLGMSKISDELARQITHLQDEHDDHDSIHAAALNDATPYIPALAAPEAVSADDEESLTAALDALPEPTLPAATSATPDATPPPTATMSKAAFFKAAGEFGFKGTAIPKALGMSSLNGIDYAEALEQLRQLSTGRDEPPSSLPAPPVPPRGFAEEIADYAATAAIIEEEEADEAALAGELASMADLDDTDDPDFGPVTEEEDGVFAPETSSPATPNTQTIQLRDEAQQRLKELRAYRSEGAPPTTELKQAFMNCVSTTLGKERTQDLIHSIWHPPVGERLNTARTRALVEWSKNDDRFEEVANVVIEIAQQTATAEG